MPDPSEAPLRPASQKGIAQCRCTAIAPMATTSGVTPGIIGSLTIGDAGGHGTPVRLHGGIVIGVAQPLPAVPGAAYVRPHRSLSAVGLLRRLLSCWATRAPAI